MASRRDELNAYTFAKRRTVAAFLQPSATGTEEGAPRPLRAVVPGLVVGALILAGFGAWGLLDPKAPKGWDAPGTKVIVGKDSTTRYVVLKTGDQVRLHPVLNLASARLLLDPGKFAVIQVDDKTLDGGTPPRGPIIGIPYAPDRLPSAKDAGAAKRWAVCQQPGGNGKGVQTAAFVLADREAGLMDDKRRLTDGQVLYVQTKVPNGDGTETTSRYLVDAAGTKYKFPEKTSDSATLTTALVGSGTPQQVSQQWLDTLNTGEELAFPKLDNGKPGDDAKVPGLATDDNKVGMVLLAQTGSGPQHYVVQAGKVSRVSPFTAWLLINAPATERLNMNGQAKEVDLQSLRPDGSQFYEKKRWPKARSGQVNGNTGAAAATASQGGSVRNTVCNVLRSVDGQGRTTMSTWAGPGFPVDISASGTSSYVTPGTGLLYTQFQGKQAKGGGALFLVTDTGLRYAVQANGDSDAEQSEIGASPQPGAGEGKTDGPPEASQAQARLGYKDVTPALVPIVWSEFLSKGPRLDTNAARQPQGS
ncbi:type VII secretion protein EccB [Streptomyces sp. NPDC002054]|uniref:type VII secretion protein EccB n=1 Tax=Streptomyces sp. NPDC002054 TaxID=3154663 RepID=UPI00332043AC